MWDHIVVGAAPTEQAFAIYTGFMVFEVRPPSVLDPLTPCLNT